jgi:uncharacterized protein YbaR (Trm112 family)
MPLDAQLLAILRCPESRQPLIYFPDQDFLLCPASGLRYRIEDGIPVMLVEEAERLASTEVDELVKKAGELGLQPNG